MLKAIVGVVAVVALAAVGCGGGESDEDKIARVVEDFFYAQGTGDGEAACSAMTNDAMVDKALCVELVETEHAANLHGNSQLRGAEVD